MEATSEYQFPIFISSTDYNLKDLRAELARFLADLGYKPILSSAEGFHDYSPACEPWESCLHVLDKSFVMVLVIDEVYGTALSWPNFRELMEERKVSPTHGEYIFGHKMKKRMLVFIRRSLITLYQSYRKVLEDSNNDATAAKKIFQPVLPERVPFETFQFIQEVKTARPIPWIREFDDITDIKKEIQKKMLNELAEIFLLKNKKLEIAIETFNRTIECLPEEEQKKAIAKINLPKEITDGVIKIKSLEEELRAAKEEKSKASLESKDKQDKLEKKIRQLESQIFELEKQSQESDSDFFIKNGTVKLSSSSHLTNDWIYRTSPVSPAYLSPFGPSSVYGSGVPDLNFPETKQKCSKCGRIDSHSFTVGPISLNSLGIEYRTCPSCKKLYCSKCWPNPLDFSSRSALVFPKATLQPYDNDMCPDCNEKNNTTIKIGH